MINNHNSKGKLQKLQNCISHWHYTIWNKTSHFIRHILTRLYIKRLWNTLKSKVNFISTDKDFFSLKSPNLTVLRSQVLERATDLIKGDTACVVVVFLFIYDTVFRFGPVCSLTFPRKQIHGLIFMISCLLTYFTCTDSKFCHRFMCKNQGPFSQNASWQHCGDNSPLHQSNS